MVSWSKITWVSRPIKAVRLTDWPAVWRWQVPESIVGIYDIGKKKLAELLRLAGLAMKKEVAVNLLVRSVKRLANDVELFE